MVKSTWSYILGRVKNYLKSSNDEKCVEKRLPNVSPLLVRYSRKSRDIHDAEFSVFSQWGDDGVIQFLLSKCEIHNDSFVEFGVGNYIESNTRFLLMNDNWKGLVIEMDKRQVQDIKNQRIYWRHEIKAVNAQVKADNINKILKREGFRGDIGLLHIDIDGNDYWIWRAIDVIKPTIAIIEYNSLLGSERAITVPYDPNFRREEAHYSYLFFGASLPALCDLAEEKGYSFVGCNSAGNNAYFVRNDRIGQIEPVSIQKGYVRSRFRESRNREGELSYLTGEERIEAIKGLEVWNTRHERTELF